MSKINTLARLPNYLSAFGTFAGLRLFTRLELARKLQAEHVLRVPNMEHPVYLRGKDRSDMSIFWQTIVRRQYDLESFPHTARLRQRYDEIIRGGQRPIIVDGGANIGLSTVWFARTFPEAKIAAVEPDPESFAVLLKNCSGLDGRVVPIQGALWNSSTPLRLANLESGAAARRVTADDNQHPVVAGLDIPRVMSLLEADQIFLLKLDVEGSQKIIFDGDTTWLNRTDLVIIELEDWLFPWTGNSRNFLRSISCANFETLINGENMFCFHNRDTNAVEDQL